MFGRSRGGSLLHRVAGPRLRSRGTITTVALAAIGSVACGESDVVTSVGGVTDSLAISVASAPGGQAPGPVTALTLSVGDSVTLRATALNALGLAIGGVSVTWLSDAPSIATVSGEGLVKALSAGSTRVHAGAEGAVSTVAVTVRDTTTFPPPG